MPQDREHPKERPSNGSGIPDETELKRMADFYSSPNGEEGEQAVPPVAPREKEPAAPRPVSGEGEQTQSKEFAERPMEEITSGAKDPWIKRFYATKTKTKIIGTVVLSLLLIFVLIVGGYAVRKFAMINFNNGDDFSTPNEELYPEYNFSPMDDVANASSIKDLLRQWATNGGEKMKSKNVINVLLLGLDTRKGEKEGPLVSHADSIILASLNKKEKTITLVSLMRDSYTYTNADKERYCKLTEVYFWAGPQALIETIENDFKIEIDDYVSVNFETFPKVIDAVGGVEIDVTEAEAHWLSTNEQYNDPIPTSPGLQILDGAHALAYSRIRHLDSDIRRTERQRYVITQLIEKSKSASASQINDLLDAVLPNVSTSFGRAELVSLGTQAFLHNWMGYEIKQLSLPEAADSWGGYLGDTWYWVVDFPASAQKLQMAIYGTTNIVLKDDRVTAVDLSPGGKKGGTQTEGDTTTTTTPVSATGGGKTKPHTTTRPSTSPSKTGTSTTEPKSTAPKSTEPPSASQTEPQTKEPESDQQTPAGLGE